MISTASPPPLRIPPNRQDTPPAEPAKKFKSLRLALYGSNPGYPTGTGSSVNLRVGLAGTKDKRRQRTAQQVSSTRGRSARPMKISGVRISGTSSEGGAVADPDERLTVLGPHVHDGVRLSEAAAAAGVPERTARRWLAAYEADGAAGLVRSARADRGEHRIPGEMRALIEGMALRRPPPRAAEVHRAVVAVAALDRGLVTMAHHGPEAYRNDFELVLRRESAHPNDLWQADHTELDVMVLDETGKPARPWLTVILDDHSRAVAGYTVFLGDPTALQ